MRQTWKDAIESYDDRRDIAVPGDAQQTISYCAEHFIGIAEEAISHHGRFSVALSGGSTPKAIYELLASPAYRKRLDWSKVQLFWSDERCVSPDSQESNFHMAMTAGFSELPIPQDKIFRMPADSQNVEEAAKFYESIIQEHIPSKAFDLVMLGMGEDGHTASLFPKTHALHVEKQRLVVANYIPQKEVWRMTLTFDCINASRHTAIYVIGKSKDTMLEKVLTSSYDPDTLPVQRIGTRTHKALWIADSSAAELLKNKRT